MRRMVLVFSFTLLSGFVAGCSKDGGSSPPVQTGPTQYNGPQNSPKDVSSMSDAELIDATPAFRNEGVTVATRRLNAPGGNAVVAAGSVAFSDPRPDASDANLMLVDVVVDYGYDNNAAGLAEAWAKQNAPIVNNYDAVLLTSCGDNGYRGTLKVPVAVGTHFTLLKTSPAVIAAASTVDPSWFFTGLPYDSAYDDPPQELLVWVAEVSGVWRTFVKAHPGAPTPPPPLTQLPHPVSNPPPSGLQITSMSATPSPVTEEQGFTLQAAVSGGTGSLSYQWAQFAGPIAPIADNFALSTTATAPVSSSSQVMEFSFTATDQNGSVTRTMSVTVNPVPPVSVSGAAASPAMIEGGQDTTLSVQAAGGKGAIRYQWNQVSGPSATIQNPQAATTVVSTAAVTSDQDAVFTAVVSDDRISVISSAVVVRLTAAPIVNAAPTHVATVVAGVDSSSTAIAALTRAMVQVSFRDDDGDVLSCSLQRLAGEAAAISLVSSATSANVTTFTFDVVVGADPANPPGTFSFDAVATDPAGAQAASPQRQLRVFRCNRMTGLPGFRAACAQVDAAGLANEGPGMIGLGAVAPVSANEVDADVFVDYPNAWVGADNSVQNGWTPHLFRNPLNGGVPSDYYTGIPLTLAYNYGTGKVFKATVRLRTDVGQHLLWATRNGGSSPGDPANVYLSVPERNHNYDNADPDRGFIIDIDTLAQDVGLPPAPPP